MGGVQFLKPRGQAPGNFTRMLQVQRGNCSIVLNEYTRWADVWGNAKKWFDIVFPVVLSGRPLVSFTLQYHDVFSWRDNPQLLDFSEVFKADSPYLPPNCYSLRSAWHSHHGFISEIGDPYPGTEIDNINITINDIGAERQVSAMLVHKLTLATPVWSSDTATTVDSLAQILHERNKKLLREIFSESVQQKIGLTVKEDDAK
jgi:hypothetical protein